MSSIFSERFKSARLLRGLSLAELADKLENKISRQALHKYERGEASPGSDMLGHLCKALEVPQDFFFRQTKVELGEIAFRKLDKLPAKEENRIMEETKDYLARYLELEEIIGIAADFINPLNNFRLIKTFEDVEDAALEVRKQWTLGNDAIANTVQLLEDNHIKVIEIEAEVGFDGMQTMVNGKIPVIAINISRVKTDDRKRFTVMHELGHLLMKIDPEIPKNQKEKFCHFFAGAMLFPKVALIKELGASRSKLLVQELGVLKGEYGISIQAMVMRAMHVEIISKKYCDTFFHYIREMNWQTEEPFKFESGEKSRRFNQLLYRALGEELISLSKAAGFLNKTVAEFRAQPLLNVE
ncbi:MAG: ImmA/IrrE family metallo-endopeptidase [Bacteroidetes bacterium]|nr:ImmA/IrrE family metallo-endopeptidase [Bacteroidota bacterium]